MRSVKADRIFFCGMRVRLERSYAPVTPVRSSLSRTLQSLKSLIFLLSPRKLVLNANTNAALLDPDPVARGSVRFVDSHSGEDLRGMAGLGEGTQ